MRVVCLLVLLFALSLGLAAVGAQEDAAPVLSVEDKIALMAEDPDFQDEALAMADHYYNEENHDINGMRLMSERAPLPTALPAPTGILNSKGEAAKPVQVEDTGKLGTTVAVFTDRQCSNVSEVAAHSKNGLDCFHIGDGKLSVLVKCAAHTRSSSWVGHVYQSTDCTGATTHTARGAHLDTCQPLGTGSSSSSPKFAIKVHCGRAILAGHAIGAKAKKAYKSYHAINAGTKKEVKAKAIVAEKEAKKAAELKHKAYVKHQHEVALEKLHKKAVSLQEKAEKKKRHQQEKMDKAAVAYKKKKQKEYLRKLISTYQSHIDHAKSNITKTKGSIDAARLARVDAEIQANATDKDAISALKHLKETHAKIEVIRLRMQAAGIKDLRAHVTRALHVSLPANLTVTEKVMLDTVRSKLVIADNQLHLIQKYLLLVVNVLEKQSVANPVILPTPAQIQALNLQLGHLQSQVAVALNRSSSYNAEIATHTAVIEHHTLVIRQYEEVITRTHRVIALIKVMVGKTKEEIAKPVCKPECQQGTCIANSTCRCYHGFTGIACDHAYTVPHHLNVDLHVNVTNRQYDFPKVQVTSNTNCKQGVNGAACTGHTTTHVNTYVKVLPAPVPPAGDIPYDSTTRYGIPHPVVIPVGKAPHGSVKYDSVSQYWPADHHVHGVKDTSAPVLFGTPEKNATNATKGAVSDSEAVTWDAWEKQAGIVQPNTHAKHLPVAPPAPVIQPFKNETAVPTANHTVASKPVLAAHQTKAATQKKEPVATAAKNETSAEPVIVPVAPKRSQFGVYFYNDKEGVCSGAAVHSVDAENTRCQPFALEGHTNATGSLMVTCASLTEGSAWIATIYKDSVCKGDIVGSPSGISGDACVAVSQGYARNIKVDCGAIAAATSAPFHSTNSSKPATPSPPAAAAASAAPTAGTATPPVATEPAPTPAVSDKVAGKAPPKPAAAPTAECTGACVAPVAVIPSPVSSSCPVANGCCHHDTKVLLSGEHLASITPTVDMSPCELAHSPLRRLRHRLTAQASLEPAEAPEVEDTTTNSNTVTVGKVVEHVNAQDKHTIVLHCPTIGGCCVHDGSVVYKRRFAHYLRPHHSMRACSAKEGSEASEIKAQAAAKEEEKEETVPSLDAVRGVMKRLPHAPRESINSAPPCPEEAKCCTIKGKVMFHGTFHPALSAHHSMSECSTSHWSKQGHRLHAVDGQESEAQLKHQTFINWKSGDGNSISNNDQVDATLPVTAKLAGHVCDEPHNTCCAHPQTGLLHINGVESSQDVAAQIDTPVCGEKLEEKKEEGEDVASAEAEKAISSSEEELEKLEAEERAENNPQVPEQPEEEDDNEKEGNTDAADTQIEADEAKIAARLEQADNASEEEDEQSSSSKDRVSLLAHLVKGQSGDSKTVADLRGLLQRAISGYERANKVGASDLAATFDEMAHKHALSIEQMTQQE